MVICNKFKDIIYAVTLINFIKLVQIALKGDVEETVTTVELDEETMEEIFRVSYFLFFKRALYL